MVRALSLDVWEHSNREQLPWKEGNSLKDFYFNLTAVSSAPVNPRETEPVEGESITENGEALAEHDAWNLVKYRSDAQSFRDFLKEFPAGANANCAQCPVESVEWNDAQEFIKRLNARRDGQTYRLPTEAEWEYAARAGTSGAYAGNLDAMAWYGNNSGNIRLNADKIDNSDFHKRLADNGNKTHSVGTKQPNAWGLYDMNGNVWEWCQDWFAEYSAIPAVDPSGPVNGEMRVARGGAYNGTATNARFAYRFSWRPNLGDYPFGLRVVAVARTQ